MRDLAVDALATYRLARLVHTDTFPPILKWRQAFVARHTNVIGVPVTVLAGYQDDGQAITEQQTHEHEEPDAWAELVECAWCSSVWVAFGVLAARRLFPRAWDAVARPLAFSAVAGLLSTAAND